MAFAWVFLSFILSSCVFAAVESSTVVVECPFGRIQGAKKTDEDTGQSYLSFKAIPYAKPPIGDLRFAKPQPHPNIDDVFDASTDARVICPHPSMMTFNETDFQEDCLILNIQTKDVEASKTLRKVVVFVHGGAFRFGTSAYYDGISFAISQDVVVVSINYRIGVLGFLSTENEASPGNYGLWDQTLAIKWVMDNIRAFGGDPDDIAIAGESAGGAAVGYQAISPQTKGLFTKVYPQSATASSVFALSIDAQLHALEVAKQVGCWDKDVENKINVQESKALIDCLRKAPVSAIMEFNSFVMGKTQFVPIVDGDFIPDTPAKLLQDDDYLESIGFFDRSYLLGINNNEVDFVGHSMSMGKSMIFSNDQMTEEQKEMTYSGMLAEIKNMYLQSRLGHTGAVDEDLVSKIDDFYDRRFSGDGKVVNMVSDLSFLIPALDFLAAASRRPTCSSYFLYFDYFPTFMKGKYRGTVHGLDIGYWFDTDLSLAEQLLHIGIQGDFTKEDADLKRSFSTLVGDFVKTGNPGLTLKDSHSLPSGWPKYDVTSSHYLHFNSKPWISSFLEKDRQDLWLGTVPRLTKEKKSGHDHSEL